jgi:hypothetical protein
MRAEANVQTQAKAGPEPRAPLMAPAPDAKGEAARKFAGLLAGKDGKTEPKGQQVLAGREQPKGKTAALAEQQDEPDALAGVDVALARAPASPAKPKPQQPLVREDAASPQPVGERPATIAAPQATAAADPADAAAFAQALDRIHAETRASSETQLTLPEGRWVAQGARIAAAPDGAGVSLSLDLRQGEQHDQAATRELRRRLEARGIRVASIEARS